MNGYPLVVMNFIDLLLLVGISVSVGLGIAILRKLSQPADTTVVARIEAAAARLTTSTGKITEASTTAAGIEPASTEGT